MKSGKSQTGICRLCGADGRLSFEHVPPQAAFNDHKVVTPDIRKALELRDLDDLETLAGPQSQRGQGGYTLCSRCNSFTGAKYVPHYVSWAYQAAHFVKNMSTPTRIALPYHILPLRIIKQIVCMFFSVNPPSLRQRNPFLEKFVLDPSTKFLPPDVRVYAGLNKSNYTRSAGLTGSMVMPDDGSAGQHRLYSEISYPPFSLILSLGSPPPEHEMLDISFFANYSFNDYAPLHLPLPLLSVYTPFPGDFRSRGEVRKAIADSKRLRSTPYSS